VELLVGVLKSLAVGLGAAVVATSCIGEGEQTGSEKGKSSQGVSAETIAPLVAAALCDAWAECDAAWVNVYYRESGCEAGVLLDLGEDLIPLPGRDFDLAAAQDCLDQISSAECAFWLNEACLRVFRGTLSEGDECLDHAQCGPNLRCEGSCPGTCRAIDSASGTSCFDDYACQQGLVCSTPYGDCVEPSSRGEPCGEICEELLFCDEISNTCQRPEDLYERRGVGQSCEVDLDCSFELLCVDGRCTETKAGESCLEIDDFVQCSVGQYCTGTFPEDDGICESFLPHGAECELDEECGWQSECGPDDTCVALRPVGDSCARSGQCNSSRCIDGVCRTSNGCLATY
jgi:hypothetical protein